MKKLIKSRFVLGFTILFAGFYFAIPSLADWIVSDPVYAKYADRDAPRMVIILQQNLIYPFGIWLKGALKYWIVIPYYFLLFLGLRWLLGRFKVFWKWLGRMTVALVFFLFCFPNTLQFFENHSPSVAAGSVARGSIKHAKRMYYHGNNYTTYSFAGYLLGRTFAHDKVRQTIVDAYAMCETTVPDRTFVIGEIGHRKGGHFPPHRTHRNGMSVDFMTPITKAKRPYFSRHLFNLWGYRLEFDNKGIDGSLAIDYEAMAQHLSALEASANKNGLRIQKIIFDPILRPYLLATPSGKKLKHLPWTKNRVVIRHDDHYHVDFLEVR